MKTEEQIRCEDILGYKIKDWNLFKNRDSKNFNSPIDYAIYRKNFIDKLIKYSHGKKSYKDVHMALVHINSQHSGNEESYFKALETRVTVEEILDEEFKTYKLWFQFCNRDYAGKNPIEVAIELKRLMNKFEFLSGEKCNFNRLHQFKVAAKKINKTIDEYVTYFGFIRYQINTASRILNEYIELWAYRQYKNSNTNSSFIDWYKNERNSKFFIYKRDEKGKIIGVYKDLNIRIPDEILNGSYFKISDGSVTSKYEVAVKAFFNSLNVWAITENEFNFFTNNCIYLRDDCGRIIGISKDPNKTVPDEIINGSYFKISDGRVTSKSDVAAKVYLNGFNVEVITENEFKAICSNSNYLRDDDGIIKNIKVDKD